MVVHLCQLLHASANLPCSQLDVLVEDLPRPHQLHTHAGHDIEEARILSAASSTLLFPSLVGHISVHHNLAEYMAWRNRGKKVFRSVVVANVF